MGKRLGFRTGVGVALTVFAFVAVVGTGLAASAAKPTGAKETSDDGPRAEKVDLCHKQKVTIRVSVNAKPAHEAHGDTTGACAAAAGAKKAKPSKAEKDAAKAARKAKKSAEKAKQKQAKAEGKTSASDDT